MSDATPEPPDDGEPTEAKRQRIAADQPPFAELLGVRLVSVERERVVAELHVRPELGNRNGVLHGGALMALADNLGGTAASMNLPDGVRTTTIESKTNFFRAISIGGVARAECTFLHNGRTTMVLQTQVFGSDGKLAAVVTQTQLALRGR